ELSTRPVFVHDAPAQFDIIPGKMASLEDPNVIEETRLRCGKVPVWAMIGWEGLLGMRILDET
ncbi:hypothetical protein L9F63_000631, partial [Diploptera punctata]